MSVPKTADRVRKLRTGDDTLFVYERSGGEKMAQYLKTMMRRILTVLLTTVMILPVFPAKTVFAENTVTTDRDTYEVGDPVCVTATAGTDVLGHGAWISLLKEEDDPATSWSYYWYYVDGYDEETGLSWRNGQTYNIFTDAVNSKRNGEQAGHDVRQRPVYGRILKVHPYHGRNDTGRTLHV